MRDGFRPLKITAHLQCGVISDQYFPIDALLYHQAHREVLGAQDATFSGRSHIPHARHISLPLKRIGNHHSKEWYYSASFAVWPEHIADGSDHWNKRLDRSLVHLIDFQGRRGTVNMATGKYRAYHVPIFYRHALTVSWYVVGDAERIAQLLSTAFYLGKKPSQGWGAVRRWEIEPSTGDWSVHGPGGRLMRAVPQEGGTLYGIRPSYWHPRHQVPCRLPAEDQSAAGHLSRRP